MMIQLTHNLAPRTALLSVAPGHVVATGENRLESAGNTGIDTGVRAHAAVRMHASPVFGKFWSYCQKPMTSHFQRWKVAT